jgi:hypothetical protein
VLRGFYNACVAPSCHRRCAAARWRAHSWRALSRTVQPKRVGSLRETR